VPIPESQSILVAPTEAAIFLVLTVDDGAEAALRDALADVGGMRRSVGFRVPEAGLTCVVGIGARLWRRTFGDASMPADLHEFRELRGPRHVAPATAGDLLLHIRASRLDLCFELAQRLVERVRAFAQVIDEVHGFRSFDERDVLGFVDGTENPEGEGARAAALIGEQDADYAGGSYVIVQKYLHDLDGWDALETGEQERIIGRTKLSDLELADDVKPPDSHVALNTIVDADGNEREIVRFNMPFGRVGAREFGTYFIGYAADPGVIELMLEHMFLGDPPGTTDRILEFSTAITGVLFFVPPLDFLDDPPEPAERDAGPEAPAAPDPGEGSLGIGGMR
jgi:porphyrinogen peroxidase